MTPSLTRRLDATGSIQQPAFAGGAATAAFTVKCMTPVSVGKDSAMRFKLATTFNKWESLTAYNPAIKAGQVLTVNSQEFAIVHTGDSFFGRSPVTQLILEQPE